jgi:serine phosphatase RsbU (regulator of sigma subunit)
LATVVSTAGSNQIQLLNSTGFLVGMMEDAEWTTNQISVQSGNRILISTDGLAEAFNPLSGPFGRNRTIQILEESRDKPIESILPTLRHAVQDFVRNSPLTDDLTILVVEFNAQYGA